MAGKRLFLVKTIQYCFFLAGKKWLQASDLHSQQIAEVDKELLTRSRQIWAAIQQQQHNV